MSELNRVDGGVKGHVRTEDLMALYGSDASPWLAIEMFPGQLHGKVQGCGAAGKAHGIFASHFFCDGFLAGVDVGANG